MRVFEVAQIAGYVNALFQTDEILSDLWLRGEVGDYTQARSGHVYFSIVGDGARIRCVLFRGHLARIASLPNAGDEVVLHGALSFYEERGSLDLLVDQVYPAGMGIARIQFEALKRKLEEEGLFEESRKRALPPFPRVIGVCTSETGAVIHDILTILQRRYPLAEVILSPCAVQGEQAPAEIVAAIARLNRYAARNHLDLIVVARGGGSEGELACFNDERVVRAAFGARVPLVSAIGHETDYTLLDLAADLRAPTPSAAAELIVPDVAALRREAELAATRLASVMRERLRDERYDLDTARDRLMLRSPLTDVARLRAQAAALAERSRRATHHGLELARRDAAALTGQLEALSPVRTMQRGYSLVCGPDGALVTSTRQLQAGDALTVRTLDGRADAVVTGTREIPLPAGNGTEREEQRDAAAANV